MADDDNPALPFDENMDDTLELADFIQEASEDEASVDEVSVDETSIDEASAPVLAGAVADEPGSDEPNDDAAEFDRIEEAVAPASWIIEPREEPGTGGDPEEASTADDAEGDDDEWHEGPSVLDDFTNDDYVAATTREYQGLAESVRESETQQHELQAVAATMPGIEGGLVGFEDVTGETVAAPPLEPRRTDLTARVATALVLVGLLLASLWAGGGWFVVLATAVSVLALGEFYAGVRRVGYVPVALFGLLGAIAAMVSGWFSGSGGLAGAVVVFVMFILLWYSVLVRRNPLQNAAITIFGFVWIAGLLAFAAAIAASPEYIALIVGLVLIAASLDIGSYFVGRALGRRQLAPILSPKKTLEGLIGGIAVAFVVAIIVAAVPFFDPIDTSGALWLALAVAVVSPIGDLAESMVKRSLGLKDMGSILPGHGGLLDRIDGLLFAVPTGYFVYAALGYL